MRIDRIKNIFEVELKASLVDIEDESHSHARGGNKTHLKCLIVSSRFEAMSRVRRQQLALSYLDLEFKSGLHAFTLRCITPEEYRNGKSEGFISPECASKKTKD